MIIDVIPFRRSFGSQAVSYSIPDHIQTKPKIGSLVYVPWRNDDDIALVVNIHEEIPTYELKEITRLEYSDSILDPIEIALLFSIARKFFLPLHKVLQLCIPLPILWRFERKSYLDLEPSTWKSNKQVTNKYTHCINNNDFENQLRETTKNIRSVVIVPHAFMIDHIASIVDTEVTIDTPFASPAKQFHAYQNIAKNTTNTVIGTRKTLLRRLGNYDRIVYLDDGVGTDLYFFQYKLDAYWLYSQFADLGKSIHTLTQSPKITNIYENVRRDGV